MRGTCDKCGSTENYNFAINNGMCNSCIEAELERITARIRELEKDVALGIKLMEEKDKVIESLEAQQPEAGPKKKPDYTCTHPSLDGSVCALCGQTVLYGDGPEKKSDFELIHEGSQTAIESFSSGKEIDFDTVEVPKDEPEKKLKHNWKKVGPMSKAVGASGLHRCTICGKKWHGSVATLPPYGCIEPEGGE